MTEDQWKRLRAMDATRRKELVRIALQQLAVDHRNEAQAIVLRVHFKQGVDDIAKKTGVTKGTVSKRCVRAQLFLEQIIEKMLG